MAEVYQMTRAWAVTSFAGFDAERLLRDLALRATTAGYTAHALEAQAHAWRLELTLLDQMIRELIQRDSSTEEWVLLLEYEIPRRQRRIDKVILARDVILVLEFKIGAGVFSRDARWQAEDYAHDLRDYHAESHSYTVVPFLVATKADATLSADLDAAELQLVGHEGLASRVLDVVARNSVPGRPPIDSVTWDASRYQPTPTVVEATRLLFSQQSVRDLSHAYADNLTGTVDAVIDVIRTARANSSHVVCFVTGVPGAGKTLAGLVGVHDPSFAGAPDRPSAFLSGNGPLVKVLRAALVADAVARRIPRQRATRDVEGVIQNVHKFVEDHAIKDVAAEPPENVIVFDEAQRAWDAEMLHRRHPSLQASEPAVVLSIMARKKPWAVVIALVGGGQEIHRGEAGLEEWGAAVSACADMWKVVASPEVIRGGAAVANHRMFRGEVPANVALQEDRRLHLSVSVRSPRAQHLAEWVNAVLDVRPAEARRAMTQMRGYRMAFTRDLEAARQWLRDASREEQRAGLLASSGNLRLRAYGIEMDQAFLNAYPIHHWFLAKPNDIRSSYALEVAMSEFKCQGLELDWAGLCWGDDLAINESYDGWSTLRFVGRSWQNVAAARARQYLLNKYRVLLTRAREGMILWIPPGDSRDKTRDPKRLNRTAEYLAQCGLAEVP